MPLCAECGEENPERARFCLACGSSLDSAPAPAAVEERRTVTVVFTDIVGSTASAEQLDPEDVRARLAPYYTRVRRELESFGGTVEKFIGDAVVALFGAPVAHEDDPERAVRATLAVREAIAELNAADEWLDLNLRTGVHTGEALVVLGARTTEGEGMAAGDVMNTAARLQSAAPVNGIIAGEATYRATSHVIEYREAEPVQAKGKTEPIPVWEVVAVRKPPSSRAVSGGPFVGRGEELDRLENAWERVRSGRGGFAATILGPPGIGKSRFLREFTERVEPVASVYRGRCLPYGEGITYWAITEILKGAAGILHDDGSEVSSRKLGALLERLPTTDQDELRTMAAALATLAGVATTPAGTYTVTEITQAEMHWGIRRILELLAAERPLVLVVEDLHWAEPTLLELVESVAGASSGAIFLLGSARPELADTYAAFTSESEGRLVIELEALPEEASGALLAGLLGTEEVPEGPLKTLLENAGGNPLFLEETVGMLKDAGLVSGGRITGDVGALPVPTSLQALIGSRLDQLSAAEKRVAQHASVVGVTFWSGSLAHLDGIESDLDLALETLQRRDFVRAHESSTVAGEREYGFKHVLIRDVAYGQLPKGRRADLHLRFADWVRALPGREEELIEIVAYHLEQACLAARAIARSPVAPPVLRAVDALGRAAGKSERREGYGEAERFYVRALALLDGEHAEVAADIRVRHGRALVALGELRRATAELTSVAQDALALGRSNLRGSALVELADIDQRQGRPADGRRRLAEAAELAEDNGDMLLGVRAAFVLASLRAEFDGALDEAVEDLRRSVAIAEEIDDRSLRTEGHLRIAALLFNLGRLAEVEEQLGRCLALAGEMGSHRVEAEATSWLSVVKYYQGEFAEAERLGLQAAEWLDRTSDSYFQVQNLVYLARYALDEDDSKLAEERLRDAIPIALGIEGWVVVESYRFLVEALVREGQASDARELADFAARGISEEDPYAHASVLLARGTVSAAEGHATDTRNAFTEALGLLESLHMPVDTAEARIAFAGALARLGDVDDARAELGRARELFEAMGATGALVRIERVRDRLPERAGAG
jgi:class 3 adenylate cyclase/tetratricopeptide (TPR) repeat protein